MGISGELQLVAHEDGSASSGRSQQKCMCCVVVPYIILYVVVYGPVRRGHVCWYYHKGPCDCETMI